MTPIHTKNCTYRACHKMLMFMKCRQHSSSRSLITPSICYDTSLFYSDLLITRNIYAIMEFYVDDSASHFMRLFRKGTDNSHNTHNRLFSAYTAHIHNSGHQCTLSCCRMDQTTPLCYWLLVLCCGGGKNHHCSCGGRPPLFAAYGEPPIEPLNSAAKTCLVNTLLLWNVDI